MDSHIRKVYVPMTETGFYILLCLQVPNHGYGVVQRVEQMTEGEIRLSPGTMYGSLSKMEKDGLISFVREEEKRKLYKISCAVVYVCLNVVACTVRIPELVHGKIYTVFN